MCTSFDSMEARNRNAQTMMINSAKITPFQMVESKLYLSRNEKCHQLQQRNGAILSVEPNYIQKFSESQPWTWTHTLTAVNSLKRKRIVKNSIRLSNELTGRWDLWFRFANANTKKTFIILLLSLSLSDSIAPFWCICKAAERATSQNLLWTLTTNKKWSESN